MNSLQDPEKTIEELAIQITRDLEERVWLRKLAEHLDYCQADTSLEDVAGRILPSLGGIIGARAIVLLKVDDHPSRALRVPSLFWFGDRCTDDDTCRRLLALLEPRAKGRVAVHNHLDQELRHAGETAVTTCMLGTLQRHSTVFGWLLALEKIPDEHCGWIDSTWESGKDEFGTVEADLLTSAATLLSTHARNVQLFREKEKLLIGAVQALVSALDARDSYSRGHSERVAGFARCIGQQIGIQPRECDRLYLAGLLHDIGKIGIPDELLRKLDRLTEEEFEHIKRHSEIGYGILRELSPMADVLPGILHHHERIDGKGYPHKLAADEIPLFARILAVADAYDAMVSDRPYRKGMTAGEAETVLREGAGSQWDAGVVQAFFDSLDQIHELARTLPLQWQDAPDESLT